MKAQNCITAYVSMMAIGASLAAAPATNVWTGAGGDFNWSNMANWRNANGSSTPVGCADGCVWDLTSFPAGGTLTDDFSGNLLIRGLVFGENMGTVTLVSKSNSCLMQFPNGQNSSDNHTWITVPNGTTVDFCLRHADEWKQWYTHLRGGGTFRINGYFKHVTVGRFFLEDITFVVGANWTARTHLLLFQLESDGSTMVFEQDRDFGNILPKSTAVHPKIYLNGHVCRLRRMTGDHNTLQIMTYGTLGVCNGAENTFSGSFASSASGFELDFYNGDLLFDSVTSTSIALNFLRNSRLGLYGDQTVSMLKGDTPEGGVSVPSGATLTVAGEAETKDCFPGAITGTGSLEVNGGAGYELKLTGASDYAGATRVRSGTVKTERPKSADGLVAYWNFEDGADGRSVRDVSSVDPMTLTNIADYAYFPAVVEGGAGGGRCARFVTDPDHLQTLFTASPRPERFNAMSNDYSVVMYLKPDGRTMVEDAGKEGVVFYDERPNSYMHIFYNAWVNYGMNWVYFNSQRYIRFSGTGNGATGDYTLAIPAKIDMFDGGWHQLAWTYDRSSLKICIYIDGELVNERTRTTDFSLYLASGLRFGAYAVNTEANRQRGFDGDMDNIQIWNRALTPDEVAADWRRKGNLGGASVVVKQKPVAHWKFDDPSNLGKDSSGNDFHLTAVNGAGRGISAAPSDCIGVNGGAALIPKLLNNQGSHFALENPAAPFPVGTHSYTITLRYAPANAAEQSAAFSFGGGNAADTVCFWHRNWVPYLAVTAYDWGWIDDGGEAVTDYNYGYFHMSAIDTTQPPMRSSWCTVAFTYDFAAKEMKIFRDGKMLRKWTWVKTWPPDGGVGDTPSFCIGYDIRNGKWFAEYVDDCRVYDRALSESEVAEISRELCNGDGTVTDEVLPSTTAVTVDAGAKLSLGANQTFISIAGGGTLELFAADLTLTGNSSFSGALSGGGDIIVASGGNVALTGDGSAYSGRVLSSGGMVATSANYAGTDVEVEEGAVFSVSAAGADAPFISASGKVVLPACATVSINGYAGGLRKFTVAEGDSLDAPTDFSGWSVTGADGHDIRFNVNGSSVTLRVGQAGSQFILR